MDSTVLFPNFSTKWTTLLCYYKMVMLWPTEHKQDHKNTNKWAFLNRFSQPNELPSFTELHSYWTQYLHAVLGFLEGLQSSWGRTRNHRGGYDR